MRRLIAATFLSLAVLASAAHVAAQQDARKLKAAAEAYDRGTAAYLDGSYAEAAQWFETANRMAPAAPALMQAIRAHQHAEHAARAATLALRLSEEYGSEPQPAEYAKKVLNELAPQFVRVDVKCDQECKLDLDGKLQEFNSFFLEPNAAHTLVATFETGSKNQDIQGQAGETRAIEFEAPPPPPPEQTTVEIGTAAHPPGEDERKPLRPIFTIVGASLTGLLLAGTIVSAIDMSSGVSDYETSAKAANSYCKTHNNSMCTQLRATATQKLTDGQATETRTNVLVGVTAGVGAVTAVIALFLTDWAGKKHAKAAATLQLVPTYGGAIGVVQGRF